MGQLTSRIKKSTMRTGEEEKPSVMVVGSSEPQNRVLLPSQKNGGETGRAVEPIFLAAPDIKDKTPETFPDVTKGRLTWSTLLSSGPTASEKLTAGIATCPPSIGYLGHHRHEQAEIYFILDGEGLMKVGDVQQRVSKGALIFIPGNSEHGIRNLSEKEDLVWLYCFAADRFEDVVYKFSDGKRTTLGVEVT